MFKRRRPSFLRPRPAVSNNEDEETLVVQESRRWKRQVSTYSEFGTRTRKRQTFRRRPSPSTAQYDSEPQYFETLENPPFTAFSSWISPAGVLVPWALM